jgi:methyl-accepting chemotaxis protein
MTNRAALLPWEPIEETLAAFGAEYAAIDELVESLFAELERLRAELSQRAAELERRRAENEARYVELQQQREENYVLAASFEQQERRLTDALTLLEQMKQGMDEAPIPENALGELAQFRAEAQHLVSERDTIRTDRDAIAAERDALRAERDALQAERLALGAERDGLVTQCDRLRIEVEGLRSQAPQWSQLVAEMERFGNNLEQQRAVVGGAPEAKDDDRVSILQQERAALTAELEQVRARYADLHEELLTRQTEHREQNAQLVDEVQLLRQFVERQAEILEALPHAGGLGESIASEAHDVQPASTSAPAADPVVSSVMAQFAQLQRDVAKRRKRK